MKRVIIFSPQYGLQKGGIQTWAYYIQDLLRFKGITCETIAFHDLGFRSFVALLKDNFHLTNIILMTWKMFFLLLPAWVSGQFSKKKVVIFLHGNEILNLNRFYSRVLRYLCTRENVVFIANSKAIGELFFDLFQRHVDHVVHPFIDVKGMIRKNVKKENIFFTVTRLVKRKNLDNTIRAFAEYLKENDSFLYYIAGEGPEKKRLQALVRELKLDNQVLFLGNIDDEEKISFLHRCKLFLLPSIFDSEDGSIEGYGIVFIEANACETAVISGNTGGVIEAVEHGVTGMHCDGSAGEVYKQIKAALAHSFEPEVLKKHALKHDYKAQKQFMSILYETFK